MSAIGEWNLQANSVDIVLQGMNPPRVILTVAMSNKVREEIELSLVETTTAGDIEIPVITWSNCLPTVRSFVTPLGHSDTDTLQSGPLRYRLRAFRYSEAPCTTPTALGTPLTSRPVLAADPTEKVGRWTWDFGDPASTEKAYIAVMLVDSNVGGG